RRRHTRSTRDWSSDVCSSDLFGGLMAAHASQKLFGWFGGYGLTGTGTFFEQLGFRPGRLFAAAAGSAEFLGGVLLAVGLGGPIEIGRASCREGGEGWVVGGSD